MRHIFLPHLENQYNGKNIFKIGQHIAFGGFDTIVKKSALFGNLFLQGSSCLSGYAQFCTKIFPSLILAINKSIDAEIQRASNADITTFLEQLFVKFDIKLNVALI